MAVTAPVELASRIKAMPPGKVKITFPSMTEKPWDYQQNDIAWMLAKRQGLVGHGLGVGKTVLALGLASYLADHGKLNGMIVLCPKQAGAVPEQWAEEASRFTPDLKVTVAEGRDKSDRVRAYRDPSWDILIVNYEAARNDIPVLNALAESGRANVLYCDEASRFRTLSSKTARLIRTISRHFPLRFAATGTPIETKLEDLHSICSVMGWQDLVGTKSDFLKRYCIQEKVEFYVKGRKMTKTVTTGYKNLSELRSRLEPHYIRRTANDPEVEKHLPKVQPFVYKIPMTRKQSAAYKATKKKLVTEISDGHVKLKYANTMGRFARLLAVADGTRTLNPDLDDESAKSDWLIEALTEGQYAEDKVMVFSRFVRSLRPLSARLRAAGIEHGHFIGTSHQSAENRRQALADFRTGSSRVLLCTTAVTYSLNLQVARAVVFYGIVANPKTLEQVVGRIRRAGSPYASVHAVTLLSQGTVEEALYESVIRRNALADYVWEEETAMFERLGAAQLEEMIRAA